MGVICIALIPGPYLVLRDAELQAHRRRETESIGGHSGHKIEFIGDVSNVLKSYAEQPVEAPRQSNSVYGGNRISTIVHSSGHAANNATASATTTQATTTNVMHST